MSQKRKQQILKQKLKERALQRSGKSKREISESMRREGMSLADKLKEFLSSGILAMVFAAAGFFAFDSVDHMKEGVASYAWPSTDAVVTTSTVITRSRSGSHGRATTRSGVVHIPSITVDYRVDGVQYSQEMISFVDEESISALAAKQVVEGLPAGKTLAVFYNPDQPDRVILKPGLELIDTLLVLAGTALWLGAAIILIVVARERFIYYKHLISRWH